MDSEQKIEERKRWNAPFLRAFNYLLEEGCLEFGISQSSLTKGELCSMMGIQAGLISKYTNGTKKVSIDTMNALARVSGGKLNVKYMLGKSEYMLLENVPDNEFIEGNNPDREVMAKRKAEPLQPDLSSYINALLAKSDETIASLKRELAAKEEIIQTKDERIADLERLSEERLHRIAELHRIIDANNMMDYPFPVGTAEGLDQKDSMRL
jgi:transcriptional regulator with XRE-family HTH domain